MAIKELKELKGKCHFCGEEIDGDYYCYGCKHFVCEDCEGFLPSNRPTGNHRVEDHKGR